MVAAIRAPESGRKRIEAELVVARSALQALCGDRGNEVLRLLGELADAAVDADTVDDDALDELNRQFQHSVAAAVAEAMRSPREKRPARRERQLPRGRHGGPAHVVEALR